MRGWSVETKPAQPEPVPAAIMLKPQAPKPEPVAAVAKPQATDPKPAAMPAPKPQQQAAEAKAAKEDAPKARAARDDGPKAKDKKDGEKKEAKARDDDRDGKKDKPRNARDDDDRDSKAAKKDEEKPAPPEPVATPQPVVPPAPVTRLPPAPAVDSPAPAPAPAEAPPGSPDPVETKMADTSERNEALGQLMRAGGPSADRDANGRRGTKAPDRKQRDVGRTMGWQLPPERGTYDSKQVLVPRLSAGMRKQLEASGYTVREQYKSGLVVLGLPNLPDFDAWEAQRQLQDMFPDTSFGLNFRYGPYRAEGEGDGLGGRKAPINEPRGYAAAVINWDPELGACAAGLNVGVIDTGIDKTHPSLAGDNVRVVKLPLMAAAADTPHWHGTAVLSLLAGLPASPAPGLIPDAHFFAANAFVTNAQGKPEADSARLLQALDELDKNRVQIVNMSLVGPRDELVHEQIQRMASRGVVFVAAVGNGGPGAPKGYPAAYPEVIAVTAVDRNGASYDHASRGPHVDVAAPGVRIWAALPGGKVGPQTGTSFATPFATAVVASIYRNALATVDLGVEETIAPKAAVLGRLFGKDRKRDPVYGLGLIQAPKGCGGAGHQVAQRPAGKPATIAPPKQRASIIPAGASAWEAEVAGAAERQSLRPPQEAPPQSGWAGSTSLTRTSLPQSIR